MAHNTLDDRLDLLRLRLGDLCAEALKQDRFDRVAIVLWRTDNPAANCIVGNHTSVDDVRAALLDNHYRFPNGGKRDFSIDGINARNQIRRGYADNRSCRDAEYHDARSSIEKRIAKPSTSDAEREELLQKKQLLEQAYLESTNQQLESEQRFKQKEERDHPVHDDIMVLLGRIMELQDQLHAIKSALGLAQPEAPSNAQ